MPPPAMVPQRRLPPTQHQQQQSNPNHKLRGVGVVAGGPPITEELYEGLKMAQRGRLDDQRGTEINFEMPDFLKRGQVRH